MTENSNFPFAVRYSRRFVGYPGLALARALRQFDIETRILDKRNQHAEAGLAINLPGNAIQALERLGLKEQVDALGIPA
ncbi:FAD-dependent oxidoreductase, partial [Brucella pinnipedialis]|uniref:FAD-dependent oxidoreductase n=1 Tax=Brucella pinnipedialis TaxID=120576 RepID=UPI0002D41BA7